MLRSRKGFASFERTRKRTSDVTIRDVTVIRRQKLHTSPQGLCTPPHDLMADAGLVVV